MKQIAVFVVPLLVIVGWMWVHAIITLSFGIIYYINHSTDHQLTLFFANFEVSRHPFCFELQLISCHRRSSFLCLYCSSTLWFSWSFRLCTLIGSLKTTACRDGRSNYMEGVLYVCSISRWYSEETYCAYLVRLITLYLVIGLSCESFHSLQPVLAEPFYVLSVWVAWATKKKLLLDALLRSSVSITTWCM